MSKLPLLLLLSLGISGLPAQKPAPRKTSVTITAGMLRDLAEAGLGEKHILAVLDKNGVPTLSAEEIEDLKKAGLPGAVIQRLETQAQEAGGAPLTLDGVVQMVRAGVSPETIILTIKNSGAVFHLEPKQVVDLIVNQGIPGDVVKAMKETERKSTSEKSGEPNRWVSLDDVLRFTRAGMDPQWIIQRIAATRSRFRVSPGELINLSRKGVHADVLSEIWKRTDESPAAAGEKNEEKAGAASNAEPPPTPPSLHFRTHVDEGLGISLVVPDSWPLHRERKGANDLLSFTETEVTEAGGATDAEIQVARFRAHKPERLTETNLLPIARNFINALKSGFSARGLTMVATEEKRTWLSGRPAMAFNLTTSSENGPTMEGRVYVTWQGPFIYMLSYAASAERPEAWRADLDRCLGTFAIERSMADQPRGKNTRETLTKLFDAWLGALRKRDFIAYRALREEGFGSAEQRLAFLDESRRMSRPDRRVILGDVHEGRNSCRVTWRIVDPGNTRFGELIFRKTPTGFQLSPPAAETAAN